MGGFQILFVALVLDRIIGDPNWLYRHVSHPVVWIGRMIDYADHRFNHGANRRMKGMVLVLLLVLSALCIGFIVHVLPDYGLLELGVVFSLLAHRSLIDHVYAVELALRESLERGRLAVAKIVGRDTSSMDESTVCRASIESAAENFSDGLIAPVFWYVAFGLSGLLIYKAVNTMDSMIGYKNTQYGDFGWAAARLDDVLNFIPARLCGLLICFGSAMAQCIAVMRHYAPLHRSPNAGWPESAMAARLQIALSGPRHYDDRLHDEPYINPDGRKTLMRGDIIQAISVLQNRWISLVVLFALIALAF